jgi:hypothetical protein
MMHSFLFASLAAVASSELIVTPQDKINHHVSLVAQMNATEVDAQNDVKATTKGSLVCTIFLSFSFFTVSYAFNGGTKARKNILK